MLKHSFINYRKSVGKNNMKNKIMILTEQLDVKCNGQPQLRREAH